MKKFFKTLLLTATCFIFSASWAAEGDHTHGVKLGLGDQTSQTWTVQGIQFGHMTADAKELVFTLIVGGTNQPVDKIQAIRIWFGDIDSDSMAMKVSGSKNKEGKMMFHSHLPLEPGDDHTQFTIEVDTGSGDGELLSFKTK